MAITATYINYAITTGTVITNRQPGTYLRYLCDTAADLPTANVIDGDRGFANDSGRAYARVAGAWALVATDMTANELITTSQTAALPIGAITDGQFLKRDGANIVGATPTASVAWGGITGTLSAQTDLQTALNGKQASGSYATGTGSANGTNTGDQSSIVGISGSLAEFNTALTGADFATGGGTASGTNTGDQTTITGNAGSATVLQTPRTINGVSFNGSADISITAAAGDPSYTPGSFTVASGTGRLFIKRLQLTTTQRATISGTARLKVA